MIIVTGGAGFIGSALIWKLNEMNRRDVLVVDRLGRDIKWQNLAKRGFLTVLHKEELFGWLDTEGRHKDIEAVFHLGASSSTTELDVDYLVANNLNYSIRLWRVCAGRRIPFIYASSAATYGGGEHGFSDHHDLNRRLRPLNPYGFSKHRFDAWALDSSEPSPPFWAGLRFFNVYGPQEYHKGSQSSVVRQLVPQVQRTGSIRLFKSYRDDVAHGEQRRDFVYVKDCVNVMAHLLANHETIPSGIYNIGTGEARTFLDLAKATFQAMNRPENIEFVDMPEELRNHYQYHTQADLTRLRKTAGYSEPMTSLEEGVRDYVENYLLDHDPYL